MQILLKGEQFIKKANKLVFLAFLVFKNIELKIVAHRAVNVVRHFFYIDLFIQEVLNLLIIAHDQNIFIVHLDKFYSVLIRICANLSLDHFPLDFLLAVCKIEEEIFSDLDLVFEQKCHGNTFLSLQL